MMLMIIMEKVILQIIIIQKMMLMIKKMKMDLRKFMLKELIIFIYLKKVKINIFQEEMVLFQLKLLIKIIKKWLLLYLEIILVVYCVKGF